MSAPASALGEDVRRRGWWRRLSARLGRGNPVVIVLCALVLVTLLVLAAGADVFSRYDPNAIDPANGLVPPLRDAAHWLGTDNLGRDVWTRLMHGSRTSVLVGLIATGIGVLVGATLGIAGGMLRGRFDAVLGWLINVQLSIPAIVLAICISAVLGNGLVNVVLAISITLWPQFARVARGTTLSVMQMPYVEGAHAVGASGLRIALRYVLPNIATNLFVLAAIEFGHAVVSEAALAFLGFGVEPRRPSWGSMIAEGRTYLYLAPYLTLLPALALSVVTIAINYLGDELDPTKRD